MTRAAAAYARSFPSLPFAGTGNKGPTGTTFIPDPEDWVWARITAVPADAAAAEGIGACLAAPGYSGVQVVPGACGGWDDADENEGLRFDNGSDADRPARNPLYEA